MRKSNVKGQATQIGNVARNLTTHSTGLAFSLPFILHIDCSPVNSSVGWLFMDTLDMSLERYHLIVSDLRIARKFADYILTRRLHEKPGDTTKLTHRAFNLSLIISYCRPFTRNVEGGELMDSPIYRLAKRVLDRDQFDLHCKIIRQRNNVYAHSPAGKRFPFHLKQGGLVIEADVFAPLNLKETQMLRSIIKSWGDYLETHKSEFS
jgi:hypothetical protein